MKAAFIVLGILALAMFAGLVIRVPVKHDLSGVAAIEITAIKKTGILELGRDRVTQKIEVTDPNDLKELDRLLQTVVWRSYFDLSSLENWAEFYTLRFVRNGKEERMSFTETEWAPGGRTPPEVLAWVRMKANQSTAPQRP